MEKFDQGTKTKRKINEEQEVDLGLFEWKSSEEKELLVRKAREGIGYGGREEQRRGGRNLKGLCHEMNIFVRFIIIGTFCPSTDSFHNFCCLQ
jgi:hypothetical protein